METSNDSSFAEAENANNNPITVWYDSRKNAANKVMVTVVGNGPVYSNTINYVHAVKFSGSSANYLQISDASFLNKTDYTIFILEKRQSSSTNNYFIGSTSSNPNDALALGYSTDSTVIHAQGSNSYTSNTDSYSNSTDKARIFTFVQNSSSGKKTYINGVLAAQNSDTSQLTGLTTLDIGKSYTGEIGEIAIFTRPLTSEERKSIEDYMGKKWSRKINRDSVAGGSCIGGMVTERGCSMDCPTSSVYGVSSPSTVADGQTASATCGQSGYNGNTISLSCSNGNISGGTCGCAFGYNQVGSSCVAQCNVSVLGSSVTSVAAVATQVDCDQGGHYGSTPYSFAACSGGSTVTGSCSCATGYTDAGCSTCDSANNYVASGGNCVLGCSTGSTIGINMRNVASGSSSINCDATNFNTSDSITYTCTAGSFSVTGGTACDSCISGYVYAAGACNLGPLDCTGGAKTTYSLSGITYNVHKFTSNGSLTCNELTNNQVRLLVVGGGGSGGGDGSKIIPGGGGGGGGGQVAEYSGQTLANASSLSVTVGGGATAVTGSNNGNRGQSSSITGDLSFTAYGGWGGGRRGAGGQPGDSTSPGGGGGTGASAGPGNKAGGTPSANGSRGAGGGGSTASVGGATSGGTAGGNGANGVVSNITGVSNTYGGGGGGGGRDGTATTGGTGGGGRGAYDASSVLINTSMPGTPNTGGGGGGSMYGDSGSAGGSGVVIISYPTN